MSERRQGKKGVKIYTSFHIGESKGGKKKMFFNMRWKGHDDTSRRCRHQPSSCCSFLPFFLFLSSRLSPSAQTDLHRDSDRDSSPSQGFRSFDSDLLNGLMSFHVKRYIPSSSFFFFFFSPSPSLPFLLPKEKVWSVITEEISTNK
jgi:hypothetical protein